jgi:hypothetical protein
VDKGLLKDGYVPPNGPVELFAYSRGCVRRRLTRFQAGAEVSHVAGKPDSAEPKRGGDPDGQSARAANEDNRRSIP